MRLLFTVIVGIIMTLGTLQAQHTHHHGHEHMTIPETRKYGHHHERNEIGVSVGGLYGLDHKEWGPGFHIHYFRTLREHSRWAVGAFAEQVWLDDTHFSAGAGLRYEPVERLGFGVFPGITLARHEAEHNDHRHDQGWKTRFSMHFEVVYDLFHWRQFHLGPVVDYSWSKEDSHFMVGVHGAFCF